MKKIVIVLIILLAIIGISVGGLVVFYNVNIGSVNSASEDSDSEVVFFTVENNTTSRQIIDKLYDANLIKNKYAGYVYLKLHSDLNLQAGPYELTRDMTLEEILNKIASGDVVENTVTITFVEGKRFTYYIRQIQSEFSYTDEEILQVIKDKEYLQELIDKYWFLTDDILNDKLYYALEGYLYPDTYIFYEDASIEDIIEVLLNGTQNKLKTYEESFKNSEYSIHDLLTMASIVELEGANSDDRYGVAGVFYNRLKAGWSLGSDVTTYYAARVEMSERDLYQAEIDAVNDYNTRSSAMAGRLPVGPICNPSINSIEASLNPKKNDYFYFVADKNKKTYFSRTYVEHTEIIRELKDQGLWFEYN